MSSGHRRYPTELVAAVESLSCLRGSGMSVAHVVPALAEIESQLDQTAARVLGGDGQ
jgi:hypothetical protein